jgi:hypothetical protein
MIDYARQHRVDHRLLVSDDMRRKTDADYTFEVLLKENQRSLGARYGADKAGIADWHGDVVPLYRYTAQPMKIRKPVEIIKLCNCYDYQACETDDYYESVAAKWIDGLRHHAISNLPGYEEAPWGL